MRALASTDCGRSVEPVIVSRLTITCAKFSSAVGAAQVGDHHQPAVGRQRPHVARQVVAADHVEDHVDPAPAGRLAHRGDEVGLAVVDGELGAEGAAGLRTSPREPAVAKTRAPRARGELDRGGADARGAAVHEEALAGPRGARGRRRWSRR